MLNFVQIRCGSSYSNAQAGLTPQQSLSSCAFVQIRRGNSYSNRQAGLGLAHTQLCTGTLQQLVKQAARPAMHRRDEKLCTGTLQQLVLQCTGGTRLQCRSYSTVVQRQCEHAASNAKREQSPLHPLLHSTTPPTPLPPLLLVVLFTRLVLLY